MRPLFLVAASAWTLALVPLGGAAAAANPFAVHAIGRPAATQIVPFIVHLPLRDGDALERLVDLQGTPGTQAYHHWLSPKQFAAAFAASSTQLRSVVTVLRSTGATVDNVSAENVTAHATVARLESAFGATMATFREPDGRVRIGSRTELTLPLALRAMGADVEGIVYHGSPHPMFHRRLHAASTQPPAKLPPGRVGGARPLNRYGLLGELWFDDTKQAYRFPSYRNANGRGVTVATVNEADFSSADVAAYLEHERVGNAKGDLAHAPTIQHFLVPGAPAFDPANNASFEADLDVQQVSGMAPGARVIGFTTNAFNFPSDFLQVYDYINGVDDVDVISTSYGECENFFSAAYNSGQDFTGILHALHDTFLQGNSEGITYTVSSGDEAGLPCPEAAYVTHPNANRTYKNVPSVDIPASDPNVVAVGGGNLLTSYDPANAKDLSSRYVTENAYADPETPGDTYGLGNTLTNNYWGAGTGQSNVFAKPRWQNGATPGKTRSVPDVGLFVGGCFDGDPTFVQPCQGDVTHSFEIFGGVLYDVIGTSVAAPQFAGLLADLEQIAGSGKRPGSGRLGNVNPTLYAYNNAIYHKNIAGFDGVASFGGAPTPAKWEPAYGLGSVFNDVPYPGDVAGIPQTASNP